MIKSIRGEVSNSWKPSEACAIAIYKLQFEDTPNDF